MESAVRILVVEDEVVVALDLEVLLTEFGFAWLERRATSPGLHR